MFAELLSPCPWQGTGQSWIDFCPLSSHKLFYFQVSQFLTSFVAWRLNPVWGGVYYTTMVWCIENIQVKPSRVVVSKVGVMLLSVQDGGERQGGGYVE